MKHIEKLQNRLRGLTGAVSRFPLTAIFLLAAVVINTMDINTEDIYYLKYFLAFVVGATLGGVVQVIYERNFNKILARMLLLGAAILLTIGYYFTIIPIPRLSIEIGIRTAVVLFALLIAFIWMPVIRSKVSFNESFMVVFKAFFITLFFSGIIFLGISIILAAINQLLFTVDSRFYSHTANVVFVLFAPLFFLSNTPVYPKEQDNNMDTEKISIQKELISKATSCPKYLEILISYIIIPLVLVFTIILILYIIINIGNGFWTNNLLEPMIVIYSITVILVYILASRLENKFAVLFRKIFPKVLVPIVLIQTVSSIIQTGDMGITYSRYYVILYGIFATVAGLVFSFVPVKMNGIIAGLLIGFSLISIVPPIDAFSISRTNQINMLEEVLLKNNMLEDNTIKPSNSISDAEKQKIIKSVNYLIRMEYTDEISWIPADFDYYADFYQTFGFYQNDIIEGDKPYVYVNLPQNTPIDITGYDSLVYTNVYLSGQNVMDETIGNIKKTDKNYTLVKSISKDQSTIILKNKENQEILSFDVKEIFNRFEDFDTKEGSISYEEATFTEENDLAKITIVVQNVNMDKASEQGYYGADLYVLIQIK